MCTVLLHAGTAAAVSARDTTYWPPFPATQTSSSYFDGNAISWSDCVEAACCRATWLRGASRKGSRGSTDPI